LTGNSTNGGNGSGTASSTVNSTNTTVPVTGTQTSGNTNNTNGSSGSGGGSSSSTTTPTPNATTTTTSTTNQTNTAVVKQCGKLRDEAKLVVDKLERQIQHTELFKSELQGYDMMVEVKGLVSKNNAARLAVAIRGFVLRYGARHRNQSREVGALPGLSKFKYNLAPSVLRDLLVKEVIPSLRVSEEFSQIEFLGVL